MWQIIIDEPPDRESLNGKIRNTRLQSDRLKRVVNILKEFNIKFRTSSGGSPLSHKTISTHIIFDADSETVFNIGIKCGERILNHPTNEEIPIIKEFLRDINDN